MQSAEAFFNKPSPFQKADQEKDAAARNNPGPSARAGNADATAVDTIGAATEGSPTDARVLDAVDSAETSAETIGKVVAVSTTCRLS